MSAESPLPNRHPGQTIDRLDAGGGGSAVVWHTVRKHWTTAAATALAVILGVTFYTLGQTKIYQAASTIQFDPNPPRPLGASHDCFVLSDEPEPELANALVSA